MLESTKHTRVTAKDKKTGEFAPSTYEVKALNGGKTLATIQFQEGPMKEAESNGIFHEDLLHIVKNRLHHFQKSPYASVENERALQHVSQAIIALHERTKNRESRGVKGTSEI